jgi:hypothetical protein
LRESENRVKRIISGPEGQEVREQEEGENRIIGSEISGSEGRQREDDCWFIAPCCCKTVRCKNPADSHLNIRN